MNKRSWIFPIVIVLMNALAVVVRWNSLQDTLPAHFDLQGNAVGSMSRNVLLLSTFVTLTSGTMPVFMLAEPVILLIAVAGFIITLVKSCKKQAKNIDVV